MSIDIKVIKILKKSKYGLELSEVSYNEEPYAGKLYVRLCKGDLEYLYGGTVKALPEESGSKLSDLTSKCFKLSTRQSK